jgi:L-rhamnonate dehydratase
MERRSFLAGAATALASIPLFSSEVRAQAKSANLKITGIEIWRYTGDAKKYDAYLDEEYPKAGWVKPAADPKQPQAAPANTYMRIGTDGGVQGFYGPLWGQDAVFQTVNLRNLVGQNPLAINSVFNTMFGDHTFAGVEMNVVSAITNTLWDLKGRFCNLPVYQLLGGSRKTLNCYATTYGMPVNTIDVIAAGADRVRKAGFTAQKWFPLLGPADGSAGMEFNVNMMKTVRETCGEYYDIMIDGFMRWDLPYTEAWCKRAEQYHPRWIEEPVQSHLQVDTLSRLRKVTSIPIATGEDLYNRWDFMELLKADAVDVLQPEPERCGGITEIMKICAIASAYGLMVSPHFARLNAVAHIVASQPAEVCPWVEYRHNTYMGVKYFEKDPIGYNGKGQIVLSDRPGFGIELDQSRIVKQERVSSTT